MVAEIKKVLVFIAGAILLCLFILILIQYAPYSRQKNLCRITEKYWKETLQGRISKKYLDEENHTSETIIIQSVKKDRIMKKDLTLELSGLYEYLSVGDSIHKPSGTLRTLVVRGNEERYFTIDFGCKKVK